VRWSEGRTNLVAGLAELAGSFVAVILVSMITYGGVWKLPLFERLLFLSPALALFVIGSVSTSVGLYQAACAHRRGVHEGARRT
jgi:hypothetical protein